MLECAMGLLMVYALSFGVSIPRSAWKLVAALGVIILATIVWFAFPESGGVRFVSIVCGILDPFLALAFAAIEESTETADVEAA